MRQFLLALLIMTFSSFLAAQDVTTTPFSGLPVETVFDGSETLPSFSNGTFNRARLDSLLAYFFPNINTTARTYDPTTDPIPQSDRMKIITDVNGITWLIDSHLDTVRLHDPAWYEGNGANYNLIANGDTLFLNENNTPVDTIIFSIESPPDTAFIEDGKLILAFEGDFENADSLSLGTGLPVVESELSTDTVTLNYAETNIIRFAPIGTTTDHIRFSNLEDGATYILDYEGSETITLSDSLFRNGCANRLRFTGSEVISFYSTGDSAYVYSVNGSNLECYTPSIGAGAEYQAILDHATAQSHTVPSLSVQAAQNTLINELVASGAWALMDQFFCFVGDGDADFSLINWKSPGTNNGTVIGSPTYTSNDGWNTNATSDAINSNYNPFSDASQLTTNDGTVGVWLQGNPSSQFYFGANASPATRGEKWASTSETQMHGITITGTALSSAPATNLAQHTVSGGNTLTTYSNGVSRNTGSGTASGRTNADLYIMSINLSDAPFNSSVVSGVKYRFWYVGGDLGDLADEIYTAIDNYLTAIGL